MQFRLFSQISLSLISKKKEVYYFLHFQIMIELHFEGKRWKLWKNGNNNLVTGHSALKMFLELLLTLLLPSADSLMVTMQVSFHKQLPWKAKNTLFRFSYKHYHLYFSQTAASQTTQASSSGETDSFSQSSLSASASGEIQFGCKICIIWFWFWSDSQFSSVPTGSDNMQSEGWETGCSATVCPPIMTSSTYVSPAKSENKRR